MNPLENNERLDLLLFQYVEGELSAEEAQALERQLAVEAPLREELHAWKEAFVEACYYDTQALEEKLLQPANRWYTRSTTWMLVILVLSWLRLTPDLPDYKIHAPTKPLYTPDSSLTTKTTAISPQLIPDVASQPVAKSRKRTETKIVSIEKAKQAPEIAQVQTLLSRPILRVDTLEIPLMPGLVKTEYRKILAQSRRFTQQQKRQTLRMKEKARQQRQANEFMKGNIPYVVPLNSTNF